MFRGLLAAACLALALTVASGCGGQNQGGVQPRLANPDDPKVKDMRPVPVGGGAKGGGAQANPF